MKTVFLLSKFVFSRNIEEKWCSCYSSKIVNAKDKCQKAICVPDLHYLIFHSIL